MMRIVKIGAFLFALAFIHTGTANAQATRTWVSGVGDDVNPCSRTAPCKTFAGAISKTAAGGEINCLDPGGFGAVTITKSITIDCTGTFGSILASSTTGVLVNGANINVILRGLSIQGSAGVNTGLNGVRFLQGASLHLEDVIIQNFQSASAGAGNGVIFAPSSAARLVIVNSTIINNGSAGAGGGVLVQPTGTGSAQVQLSNVQVSGNSRFGFAVNTTGNTGSGVIATLINSRFASSANGVSITTAAGTASAQILISDCVMVNNATNGILATGPTSSARVSNSVIASNATGISATAGGFLRSIGGNFLDANSVNGTFSDTIPKV